MAEKQKHRKKPHNRYLDESSEPILSVLQTDSKGRKRKTKPMRNRYFEKESTPIFGKRKYKKKSDHKKKEKNPIDFGEFLT